MKKMLALLLAALLGGYVSLVAGAGGAGQPGQAGKVGDERPQSTVLIPELYDNLYVAGTITSLDRGTGMVGLSTDVQGEINLQFHPGELKALKVGDVAVVYLGFSIDDRSISAESCDLLAVKVANC
jgi:hypothetical protein